MFGALDTDLGQLDILFSNAGIQRPQAITDMSVADRDAMMAGHLRGAFPASDEARHSYGQLPHPNGGEITP